MLKVKTKIKAFLKEKNVSYTSIGEEFGTTKQYISQMLSPKSKIPLDFIMFLCEKYPEIDLNKLLKPTVTTNIVAENGTAEYQTAGRKREKILEEIGKILDEYV